MENHRSSTQQIVCPRSRYAQICPSLPPVTPLHRQRSNRLQRRNPSAHARRHPDTGELHLSAPLFVGVAPRFTCPAGASVRPNLVWICPNPDSSPLKAKEDERGNPSSSSAPHLSQAVQQPASCSSDQRPPDLVQICIQQSASRRRETQQVRHRHLETHLALGHICLARGIRRLAADRSSLTVSGCPPATSRVRPHRRPVEPPFGEEGGIHTSVHPQHHSVLQQSMKFRCTLRAHLLSLYIGDTPFRGCAYFGQGVRLFTSVYISLAHMHGGGDL
ncbi:hypothetical protein ACLOJK_040210 [Asimina triloba]